MLLSGYGEVVAAAVAVRAQLSETSIYLGESVTLEVHINGVHEPELPELRHPDIDITQGKGQSFNNSSISIINGRTTRIEESGYVARYHLRPRVAGTLAMPPLAITHEGRSYHSNRLTLHVRQPGPQEYLVVEVSTDKSDYVLGEVVTVILDLSIRKLVVDGKMLEVDPFFNKQPPHLQIPWFASLGEWKTTDIETFAQPLLGQKRPGFTVNDYYDTSSVFRRERLIFTLPRRSTSRQTAAGPVAYFTYQLRKQFRPIRAGQQTIPSVLVKATLPTEIDARGRAVRSEKIVASSTPLTVEVRPVPSAGQPESFYGAVGRFRLHVEAAPIMLKVGDPFTLTLTIQAEGDSLLETVRPPRLHEQPALTEGFKIPTDPPTVKTGATTKTFTYTLRPRHADVQAVPPIAVAYFDPNDGRFQVLHSKPVPLKVDGARALKMTEVIVASDGQAQPRSTVGQELSAGILANYTGPQVLAQQYGELRLTPLGVGVFVFPPIAYLLTLGLRRWQRQRQQSPEQQRARQAGKRALAALRDLKTPSASGSEAAVCDSMHRVLTSYISDKCALAGAGLTVDDVTAHLQARQIDPTLMDQTAEVLHLCDSVRYAPGSLAVAQLAELIADAEAVVSRLEEHL